MTTCASSPISAPKRCATRLLATGQVSADRLFIVAAKPLTSEEQAKLKGKPNRVDFTKYERLSDASTRGLALPTFSAAHSQLFVLVAAVVYPARTVIDFLLVQEAAQ